MLNMFFYYSGLKKYSDWPTYPQFYVSGELVGGLDIIKVRIYLDCLFRQDNSRKSCEFAIC